MIPKIIIGAIALVILEWLVYNSKVLIAAWTLIITGVHMPLPWWIATAGLTAGAIALVLATTRYLRKKWGLDKASSEDA